MAIYRNISLSFWEDNKVVDDFTPEDRYFYLYLLTNPHTNLIGCYEISIRQMSHETGYSQKIVEKLLDRMENLHNVIVYSRETKEIFIKNWCKYNWTKSEKLLKNVENVSKYIKNETLKEEMAKKIEIYKKDRVSIPYPYPMDTSVSVSVSDFNINSFINNNNLLINNNILKKLFKEYIKLRETNNFIVSETVAKRLISKLEKADSDEIRKEMLEKAIMNGWKDLYPVETEGKPKQQRRVF